MNVIRNIGILVLAVLAGFIALGPLMTAQMYFLAGRTFAPGVGEMAFYLIDLLPTAITGAIIGAVAGFGLKSGQSEKWALVVSGLVAALLILSTRYIAPEWAAWLIVIVKIVIPSVLAWFSFRYVRRRRVAAV